MKTFHDISLARMEVAREQMDNAPDGFQKATFHHLILKLASSLKEPGDARRITAALGMPMSYTCEAHAMLKLSALWETQS